MFLDIGIGIFGAIGLLELFDTSLTWSFLLAAVAFALLPDIDFLVAWALRGRLGAVSHTHRELLHAPLLYIPIGSVLIGLVFGAQFGLLFALASFGHFVHDSIGIGWGIAWWYPVSRKFYKFFSDPDGTFSWRFLVAWTPQEQVEVERLRGDPDWLRTIYLRFHPIAAIELLFFAIASVVLISYWGM